MKYQVLIADDEPAAVKMIEKIIKTRSDSFDVCGTACNGEEAFGFASNNQVDLIISDVNMPKKDGITFASEIKETKPEIETIIVSGYQDFEYVRGAIRANSSDYVLKPITPTKMLDALGRVKNRLDKAYELKNNEYYLLAKEKSKHFEELRNSCSTKDEREKLYEEIVLYMQKHLKDDLSVEDICKTMGVSQATLNRVFRQYGQTSFKEHLTKLRIKEAIAILKNVPGISIKDLSEQVGYKDQFYFSKVFKMITGMTPSEYIK